MMHDFLEEHSLRYPMKNVDCTEINLDFTHTFLPIVYILVFIIGIIGNFWGLYSVRKNWRKLGNINIFVLNLGVADLLYVFCLPFLVVYYYNKSIWIFGKTFCMVTRFCFNLNLYGSIGFLTCICIYRYLGIVHTMEVMGRIKTRHSMGISVLVWCSVLIQIIPDMFFEKTPKNSSDSCYDTTADERIRDYLPYSIGWSITGFGVPLFVILWCYGHVAVVLATRANVDALLKQRCLKLVIILIILFSVCFIPYHVLRNLNLVTRIFKQDGTCHETYKDIYVAHQVSRGLASMNSAINSLIYLLGNDDFLLRFHGFSTRARMSLSRMAGVVIYKKPQESDSIDAAA
ncbi:P2Y purinoceptor 1-like [Brienomyrus brachyistius]|uniref:P2Y purinoceptor 1-like n=1 Tax=Brienomyrus brachyistius TaxID=42636 RepID=UPI0020B25E42|nr:P2Y purinoceptor 1-like [Brienomyrus brachyistius]